MMSNHTDMQNKYCGDCYDIHPIQSRYKYHKRGGAAFGRVTSLVASFALPSNKVNIIASNIILSLHIVGSGRSEHVRLDIMFFARRASWPREAGALGDRQAPQLQSTTSFRGTLKTQIH